MSLSEYLCKFKLIYDQLNAIGKPVAYQDQVFGVLNGLGLDHDDFTTFMMHPTLPTYIDVLPILQSYELRKENKKFQVSSAMLFYG